MCLYVKEENTILTTAEKDITCYKILRKSKDNLGGIHYHTPFYQVYIELGERVIAKGYRDVGSKLTPFRKHFTHAVSGGFIHTFATIQGVKSFFKNWRVAYYFDMFEYVVVKCYIPKGAKYYKGIFETTGLASYASTELVYGKDIIEIETL